jgi:hypothetical protein
MARSAGLYFSQEKVGNKAAKPTTARRITAPQAPMSPVRPGLPFRLALSSQRVRSGRVVQMKTRRPVRPDAAANHRIANRRREPAPLERTKLLTASTADHQNSARK